MSVGANGEQGDDYSSRPVVSADGRFVVFTSHATNLAEGSTGFDDVILRDRELGTTELISVDSNEVPGNQGGNASAITPDGRYVVFWSSSTNLVPGDTNGFYDVFVRDRLQGTTERVSTLNFGHSSRGSISDDGRYVAYSCDSSGGHLFGNGISRNIYAWDRQNQTSELVSAPLSGGAADEDSIRPSISADGRYVTCESQATNLVANDDNGKSDVFVRDLQADTTECVSLESVFGLPGNGDSSHPSISADGRYVAFVSAATDLVSVDTNGHTDVFVRDRQSGTTGRVSVSSGGAQGNADVLFPGSGYATAISSDGRFVAFESLATNLVSADTNAVCDVFLRDRQLGTTQRVSVSSGGIQENGPGYDPTITADGNYVSFMSDATNLVPGDTNAVSDIFLRDLQGGPTFTSLCSPGSAGVIACPCGNPPSGGGRGCDNSSATGGAVLAAAGGTYLSSDSLVFTTSGEKPTATSVLLQGTSSPAAGIVYGQSVRCVGGTLKRLFSKSAVAGSITVPNFAAGDSTISARSAAKGNPISAAESRWYLVFYRDPIVLGGCPSSSTFNATQTGVVTWSP